LAAGLVAGLAAEARAVTAAPLPAGRAAATARRPAPAIAPATRLRRLRPLPVSVPSRSAAMSPSLPVSVRTVVELSTGFPRDVPCYPQLDHTG
jgi:hypothetical protein